MNIKNLLRKNIQNLKPYSSARSEYTGAGAIFLDANENPFNEPYNRYPDPLQRTLKARIAELKGIQSEQIFLGNGSDEAIDLLFRAFCAPASDNVIAIEPSYGMYKVCADINDVELRTVLITPDFELDVQAILQKADTHSKLLFLCSPNNPTANCFATKDLLKLVEKFNGIVIVDEAYIDFAPEKSLVTYLDKYPNLVILQTLSKAWGMAGIRLGMAFAGTEITQVLSNVKYPYNVNMLTQKTALSLLEKTENQAQWVATLLNERTRLTTNLAEFEMVQHIYPSDANFLLVKVDKPDDLYDYLTHAKVIVRNRSKVPLCEGCLRFTVGTPAENEHLIKAMTAYQQGESWQTVEYKTEASRSASVVRTTRETDIAITLHLDGSGNAQISTGLHFFDHMLDQIARHSGCDLNIHVKGDLQVDEHHTIEDTAIALGEVFLKALGNKRGIERYGFLLPMDDCLAQVAIDFGGRSWLEWDAKFTREKIGDMPTEMFYHFFKSFSDAARCNLNIKAEGDNEHHKIEAIFKGLAKAIRMAIRQEPLNFSLPSTKGVL